jgi:putative nucleotidyltransferase with HDIG domain
MNQKVKDNVVGLKHAAEESKQLFMEAVRALASAIDEKDFYTRGHSERVTQFSVEIAKIMELPEEEIEKIKIAALIHDIGKVAIDDRILKKPTMLTEEEYEIMKTHTTRGYEMLKHIPQLKDIISGLQSHHEQMDGKGYPRGLKGDEIPLIARIIMVADCFDAMTTARPYQEPAPIDYVLQVICSSAGTKYDQRVVEALVDGIKKGRIVPSGETAAT